MLKSWGASCLIVTDGDQGTFPQFLVCALDIHNLIISCLNCAAFSDKRGILSRSRLAMACISCSRSAFRDVITSMSEKISIWWASNRFLQISLYIFFGGRLEQSAAGHILPSWKRSECHGFLWSSLGSIHWAIFQVWGLIQMQRGTPLQWSLVDLLCRHVLCVDGRRKTLVFGFVP